MELVKRKYKTFPWNLSKNYIYKAGSLKKIHFKQLRIPY